MSLDTFKASATGTKLTALFRSSDTVEKMIRKSEAGRPAVEAIGKDVEAQVGALDDQQKKLVGRWAKEVLAPRGWAPDRKGRVAPGHFFVRGTAYRVWTRATGWSRTDGARARDGQASAIPDHEFR